MLEMFIAEKYGNGKAENINVMIMKLMNNREGDKKVRDQMQRACLNTINKKEMK